MLKHFLYVLSVLFCFSSAHAAHPQAAVATAHPLATDAGIKVLRNGGNAFDAAVAVSAALAVVEPYSSGFGGGGFWLLHVADDNHDVMIDGRERAPMAASRDMYLDENGDVVKGASVDGPLAAGIPGMPAALEHIALKYGKLPLRFTLRDAATHASRGFKVDAHYRRMAGFRLNALQASPDAAKIFLYDGQVPEVGQSIYQPELASTIDHIARYGAKAFYTGELAQNMVNSVRNNGGIWSLNDLAEYKVVEREPVTATYNGMRLVTASPPSSGGIALAQMLGMLSEFDAARQDEASRIHILTEVMRRAYRDRAEFLGDTDFVDVPAAKLLSREYLDQLAKSIDPRMATPSSALKPVASPGNKAKDTTHFSIIDAEGNRVAATLSINYPFGSGFVAKGSGVLLNDEMDDFSSKPGTPNVYGLVGAEANAIAPGKRMLSSMSPGFLETDDRIAVLGTPGGSRIITMVLLAMLDFHSGASAEHMVKLGRFHHQYLPDTIFYEPGVFGRSIVSMLSQMGHKSMVLDSDYGNMHVVIMDKNTGKIDAASDRRGIGKAAIIRK